MRATPPQPSSGLKPGTVRRGLDGALYVVDEARGWSLAMKDQALPELRVRVRPVVWYERKDRYSRKPGRHRLGSDRALEIVQSAIVAAGDAVHRVKCVRWDNPWYHVCVACARDADHAWEEIRAVVDDVAADTWHHGDIDLADGVRLHLMDPVRM